MVSASDSTGFQKPQKTQLSPLSSHPPEADAASLRNYQGTLQPRDFPTLPKEWVSETNTFTSSDGKLQLFSVLHHSQNWKGPRLLLILHGLGEHGGRYLHAPHHMKDTVDAVFCLDHRGHGRSGGLRGHVDRFDQYTQDAALVIRQVDEILKKKFGRSEIHLLGHSMGGLIALRALFLDPTLPIRSATVSAPLLGIRVPVPAVKRAAAKILSQLWGSLHMTSELNPGTLSHDKAVVEAYVADRLVHQKVTPRFFIELQNAMADTLSRKTGFQFPLLMLIPLQDQVVNPDLSLQFFEALQAKNKTLKTFPTFFHEPLNEIGKEKVFEDLKKWVKENALSE